ncbi:hypothetical protein DK37_10495 [Halomonas sp. SUBG004]|nr:hypothetical protein DK37_10495 [Halomonas sp. SUBG004]
MGDAALRDAFQAIHLRPGLRPDAQVEGVLVTPMAEKGVEVIIGMLHDPIFGPVLMFGLGGILWRC